MSHPADDMSVEEIHARTNAVMHPYERELIRIAEAIGFGAALQGISDEWRRRDPIGALAVGPCYNRMTQREVTERIFAGFDALEDG